MDGNKRVQACLFKIRDSLSTILTKLNLLSFKLQVPNPEGPAVALYSQKLMKPNVHT